MTALVARGADLQRARPPRWLWKDRIAIAYLNLLLGNEGIGKGTFWVWLLAQLTRGTLPGDLHGHPTTVAVIGDEDGFDDVWVPRLHAQGADLDRVIQVERPDGGFVNLREDKARLAAMVTEHELGFMLLDQLLDNLGVGTDDWRQKAVRDALQPIKALAREADIAVAGSLHPNKRADSFRQLIAGAPAFNAISRSSLLLAQHPEDEQRRVIVRGKGNLSQAPNAIEFGIKSHKFDANGYAFNVPVATEFNEGTITVDDLVGTEAAVHEHSQVADACDIIKALLPHDGAWHPAKPIYEACATDDIGDRTVKRAKARLKVEHRRTDSFPAAVEWCWPASQDTQPPSEDTVPSVPTVPTENSHKPLQSSSQDTQDRQDPQNKGPNPVPTDFDIAYAKFKTTFPEIVARAGVTR